MLDCMYIYVVIIFLINKQRPKIFKFKDSGLLCTCKVPGQDHFMRIFVTKLIFIFFYFGMQKDDKITSFFEGVSE